MNCIIMIFWEIEGSNNRNWTIQDLMKIMEILLLVIMNLKNDLCMNIFLIIISLKYITLHMIYNKTYK